MVSFIKTATKILKELLSDQNCVKFHSSVSSVDVNEQILNLVISCVKILLFRNLIPCKLILGIWLAHYFIDNRLYSSDLWQERSGICSVQAINNDLGKRRLRILQKDLQLQRLVFLLFAISLSLCRLSYLRLFVYRGSYSQSGRWSNSEHNQAMYVFLYKSLLE